MTTHIYTADDVATKSVEIIRQKHAELGELPDKDNILNIAVSYDGTWQQRGHSSLNGAGIDLLTGLPIDYEVVCNICHQCFKASKQDDPKYIEWQTKHEAKCAKNYDEDRGVIYIQDILAHTFNTLNKLLSPLRIQLNTGSKSIFCQYELTKCE